MAPTTRSISSARFSKRTRANTAPKHETESIKPSVRQRQTRKKASSSTRTNSSKSENSTQKRIETGSSGRKKSKAVQKEEVVKSEGELQSLPKNKQLQKKLRQLEELGTSPFPNFNHPTHEECANVFHALVKTHGTPSRDSRLKSEGYEENRGGVPNILDGLVSIIISQNTTTASAVRAKQSLDKEFGYLNWEVIANAPERRIIKALQVGGLAKTKAIHIQKLLREIYAKYGKYSLQEMTDRSNSDRKIMEELLSFDGVGPKSASCLLLFCLSRESFAVDTHIFRLSKALGWVPKNADREQTFQHLDVKIPADLKYPLHTLLIRHGKSCARCAGAFKYSLTPAEKCPLKSNSKTSLRDTDTLDLEKTKSVGKASGNSDSDSESQRKAVKSKKMQNDDIQNSGSTRATASRSKASAKQLRKRTNVGTKELRPART